MGKIIKINKEQFLKLRQTIGINEICTNNIQFVGYTKVIHMDGSSEFLPKNYSTWSEYWEKEVKMSITPPNKICDCCCKPKDEFVIGHVTRVDNKKHFLYPICQKCNSEGKGKSNHQFLAIEELLYPFNLSDARKK